MHYCCDCVATSADDVTEFIVKIVKKQQDENVPANGAELTELRQTVGSATLKFYVHEEEDCDDDVIGEPLTQWNFDDSLPVEDEKSLAVQNVVREDVISSVHKVFIAGFPLKNLGYLAANKKQARCKENNNLQKASIKVNLIMSMIIAGHQGGKVH